MQETQGSLFIVATPIGNLGDITLRAIETLKSVSRVYAEDTRNSIRLLRHFGINNQLFALHDHNEAQKIDELAELLEQGENLALISDAGTPLISDPGYKLVHELAGRGHKIITIPGPSAVIAALSIAGIATDRFTFEGFLPAKTTARKQVLQTNLREPRTQVYYESSHRIAACAADMLEVFGTQRKIAVARELTKLYEQVFRGELTELVEWIKADANHQKGEFVIVLQGAAQQGDEPGSQLLLQEVLGILLEELPLKQAAKLTARLTGVNKNQVYKLALELKKSDLDNTRE